MPAGLYDLRFLNSARLQRILEQAPAILERERPLTFLNRLNLINATDDELFGRFTSRLFAADVIADGQKAVVYEGGYVDLYLTSLANIKMGRNLDQAALNILNRLAQFPRAQDEDAWFDWELRFAEVLLQGVRERMNEMACGMMLDAYSYDRFGVKLTGATWGMPSNLKVTVSPAWSLDAGVTSNAANAKPVRDIQLLDQVDADNYGLGPFDRMTLSWTAFSRMVETDEFKAKAAAFTGLYFALGATAFPTEDRERMRQLASRILGKEIVIDLKTVRTMSAAGVQTTTRVLPVNKVLLDRASNGPRDWDFGNGVVTESLVAELIGTSVIGANPRMLGTGGAYGPVGYYTPQTADLNPPGINGWAVSRGFPRKHNLYSSAVLTVW
jgi:hypothetical protein